MRIGLTIGHKGETVRDIASLAALAEQSGLDVVGFPDSQSVFRDMYPAMTAAALATRDILLMTAVTNVSTRHPVVTASAMASVDELSEGRCVLAIGTGASSLANLGLPRAKPADLRAGVETIYRAFAQARGDVAASDNSILLSWPERGVPVVVSASTTAPMAMRIAAELCDGVMLINDVTPETVRDRIAHMRMLRVASSRANDPFRIWVYAPGYIDAGPGTGRATVAGTVSSTAVTTLNETRPRDGIPEALHDAFRQLREGYDFKSHAAADGYDARLSELGLADYLYGRLAIGGTEDELCAKLRGLEALGVEGVMVSGYVPDKPSFIRRLGKAAARYRSNSGGA